MALRFGIPIPALSAHVGKHIQSGTRRGGPFIVDAHGHNLLTAPGLRGRHIQRNHNGICSTNSDGLREARCPQLGTRTFKGVFRNACPAVTDEDAWNKINGIIPDIAIQTGHLSPDEHSLAGCDHLADTTTLNASKNHYHRKSTDFGFQLF
jgi:predicted secreted protein